MTKGQLFNPLANDRRQVDQVVPRSDATTVTTAEACSALSLAVDLGQGTCARHDEAAIVIEDRGGHLPGELADHGAPETSLLPALEEQALLLLRHRDRLDL